MTDQRARLAAEGMFRSEPDGAAGKVRGASLVVWAVRDRHDVAATIDTYLRSKAKLEKKAA